MKIVFDHSQDGILEAFGFTTEQLKGIGDIVYTKVVQPNIDKLREKLPSLLEKVHPMEDEDGFNKLMESEMPNYSHLAEEVQTVFIEEGYEPDMKLGYMLHHTTDKITSTLMHALHTEIAMVAIKDLKSKTEAPTEEN